MPSLPSTPPSMPIGEPLAEHRCPLCGGPNGCAAAAAGRFDVPCWCVAQRFPPALLAQVPAAQQGRACVCRACAQGAVAGDAEA